MDHVRTYSMYLHIMFHYGCHPGNAIQAEAVNREMSVCIPFLGLSHGVVWQVPKDVSVSQASL